MESSNSKPIRRAPSKNLGLLELIRVKRLDQWPSAATSPKTFHDNATNRSATFRSLQRTKFARSSDKPDALGGRALKQRERRAPA
jgi:hypothetical protein